MSQFLTVDDTDYVTVGTTLTLPLIIRASAIINAKCKREINVKSYTERVPLTEDQRGHLSYYPVLEVTGLKGKPKHGMLPDNFFGAPSFETISDLSLLDVDKNIGAFVSGCSAFGAPYLELEVTYSSGWEPIPDAVKVACGMLVERLANNPNSNVKAKKDFDYSIEYFGTEIVTPEIEALLQPYVHFAMR